MRRFTAAEDAEIVKRYRHETLAAIGAQLGRPGVIVAQRFGILARRGLVDQRRRFYRAWTAEDDANLRELWGWEPPAVVAKRLGRRLTQVRGHAHDIGLRGGWKGRYSAFAVARIFGVDQTTIKRWLLSGFIKGTKGAGPLTRWDIRHEAVEAFIRAYPCIYDRRWITDPYWRELADKVAPDVVTVLQASVILGIGRRVVHELLATGQLLGTRIPHRRNPPWRIARTDVLAFRAERERAA